jgi:hypothetical protein
MTPKPQKIEGGKKMDMDNGYCSTHKLEHGLVHPECVLRESISYLKLTENLPNVGEVNPWNINGISPTEEKVRRLEIVIMRLIDEINQRL